MRKKFGVVISRKGSPQYKGRNFVAEQTVGTVTERTALVALERRGVTCPTERQVLNEIRNQTSQARARQKKAIRDWNNAKEFQA